MPEPMLPEELDRHTKILNQSEDRELLAASAVALAASEDPAALLALARELRRAEFLNRLDDTSDPESDISNLRDVFGALAEHAVPASARLCELIYPQPDFRTIPARINLLLQALAAVRPTSAEGADVFRASSAEGFAEVNGPLLIENESPRALQVFEELIAGGWVESYIKVDILHRSVLPKRTSLPVLMACARLYERGLPGEVRDGLIETLFDHQSRRWFGPERRPPIPPAWQSASTEALNFLIAFANRVLTRPLDDRLRPAVQSTRAELESIRRARTS